MLAIVTIAYPLKKFGISNNSKKAKPPIQNLESGFSINKKRN